jgi:hypothetical protein
MLENLAQYGLVDVATDYGLILLEFTTPGQKDLAVQSEVRSRIGAEEALVLRWRQKSPEFGELEFLGRQSERHVLQGRVWLRTDGPPMRVDALCRTRDREHRIRRHEATVE